MPALQRLFALLVALLLLAGTVQAQGDYDSGSVTPPRLSHVEGEVSFWRPGVEDWTVARRNIPLAAGDTLYTADGASVELQIGSRNFVRADEQTQLALVNLEPGFLQLQVTTGRVSLDLRQLPAGQTVELNTPHAAFTIAQSGYYRVDVDHETHFITRRGGRATVIPEGGRAMSVLPAEEIVVRGDGAPRVETYAAPELDRWDRWNYARTDELLEPVSARYLSPGIYGGHDLDRYGNWRVVPRYGSVWVPDVPYGWVPYSTGRWIWDPYYEWTWVDDAPWGWAPYHYGRWVYLDGYWAWAPGPVAVRTVVYAPALVVFFWAGHDVSVRIGLGVPGVAWLALGWGEPVVPWWGRPGFRGRAWWGGWYGPRVVNNVVIRQTTVVNVTKIVYQNSHVHRAVVATPSEHFGRHRPQVRTIESAQVRSLEHVRGNLPVKPAPESLAAGDSSRVRPPRQVVERPVVSTRPPAEAKLPWRAAPPKAREEAVPRVREEPARPSAPPVREPAPPVAREAAPPRPKIVSPPRRPETVLPRPEFGARGGEERQRPQPALRYEEMRRPGVAAPAVPEREAPVRREAAPPRAVTPEPAPPVRMEAPPRDIRRERVEPAPPAPAVRERERPAAEPRALPGQPASRVYRRAEPQERDTRGRPDIEQEQRRGPPDRRN